MYLRDVGASLLRRWYFTLLGLLATAGLVLAALQVVPPTWESKASLVLLPPRSTVAPGGNPYLQLGGLAPTLDLLVAALHNQQLVKAVEQAHPDADYVVKADTSSSGPVLLVTAHDSTPAGSLAVRDLIARQGPTELAALQEKLSIPDRARITTMVLTEDADAERVGKDQIRAAVVALGVGLVGTAFSVAIVDGLLARRRDERIAAPARRGRPALGRPDVEETRPPTQGDERGPAPRPTSHQPAQARKKSSPPPAPTPRRRSQQTSTSEPPRDAGGAPPSDSPLAVQAELDLETARWLSVDAADVQPSVSLPVRS